MDWINWIELTKSVFMFAYVIFVIWSLVKYVKPTRTNHPTVRDRIGAIGLAVGMFSAALYAVFFAFLGFEKKLLLHGSALWIYYIVGALLAAIGLVLGVAGRGWVRNASILISLVMLFQWYGMMIIGSSQRADGIVTIAMFIAVAVWGILLVGSRYFHALHFRKHA